MKLKIKKIFPEAILPTYATDGSGCFDFYACGGVNLNTGTRGWEASDEVSTGIAVEIPEGHVMLIFSRSSHAFKYDVRLANCVGVIDSDYRGEIKIKLTLDNPDTDIYFDYGERIAQGLVIPIPKVEFEEVESLSDTERGAGGFGSTGL